MSTITGNVKFFNEAKGLVLPGVILLAIVYSWELWQLFRSQIIVQDWNNRLYRDLLRRY